MNPELQRQKLLEEAIPILKEYGRKIGKKGSRIHYAAAEDNAQRLRALEGICGHCVNLEIEFVRQDGKARAALKCLQTLSPLELYRKTEFGEKANCKGCAPIKMALLR